MEDFASGVAASAADAEAVALPVGLEQQLMVGVARLLLTSEEGRTKLRGRSVADSSGLASRALRKVSCCPG